MTPTLHHTPHSQRRRWYNAGPLLGAAFALLGVTANAQITVSGGSAAVNGTYGSLTLAGGAFAAINANNTAQTGNDIVVSITADLLNETGVTFLNQGNWASLTIRPVGARTISGTTVGLGRGLINLNGADNVTIDGLNSDGHSLTISNTSTSNAATSGSSTIRFLNSAENNTITRCTVLGSLSVTSATVAAATILFQDAPTAPGNDNNTISLCTIGPSSAGLPPRAIMSLGATNVADRTNSGNQVLNNNILDFFRDNQHCTGIRLQNGNDNWTISGNRIYQTAPRQFAGGPFLYTGIHVGGAGTDYDIAGAHTITDNVIGFANATGTGVTAITGNHRFRGIEVERASITTATLVQGNTIAGIAQTTTAAAAEANNIGFAGIKVGGSTANMRALVNIKNNTIGSLDGANGITITANAGITNSMGVIGILDHGEETGAEITGNNIGSITIDRTAGTNLTTGFRGIHVTVNTPGQRTRTIDDNTIGSPAGPIFLDIAGNNVMHGIHVHSPNADQSVTTSATGNTISNLTSRTTNTSTTVPGMAGMAITGSPQGAHAIARNTIHSLHNLDNANNAVWGIALAFHTTTADNVVERNLVHSLTNTGTGANAGLVGIGHTAGTVTLRNNMVRLGIDAEGDDVTLAHPISGIRHLSTAGAINVHHNSVYIGGATGAMTPHTYAFRSDHTTAANVRDLRNNIFFNARTRVSGAGNNYAISVAVVGAGLTSDHNVLRVSAAAGSHIGQQVTTDHTSLADWVLEAGRDQQSHDEDPQFILPDGTAATLSLHIKDDVPTPVESNGVWIASVPVDFDGEARDEEGPDIGADEGDFMEISAPVYDCPGLQADIGDPCDPGPDLQDGQVTSDCTCVGTPIPTSVTGVDGGGAHLALWPNPNNGQQVWISFALPAGQAGSLGVTVAAVAVDIHDLGGRQVMAQQLPLRGGQALLDLGGMAPGTYMVHVTAGGDRHLQRLVIQP